MSTTTHYNLQPTHYSNLPSSPGVYFFRDKHGKLLYIGKAINLKRRVSSYFQKNHIDLRIDELVSRIKKINIRKTDSVIEALILEANLIRRHQPFYNIKSKDDKSFVNIAISREEFPRVFIMRLNANRLFKNIKIKKLFGPYPSAATARTALKILRRIFLFRGLEKTREGERFYWEILEISENKERYNDAIKNLMLFLSGKKKRIIGSLKKEMKRAAKNNDFEDAARLRDQIFALEHIQDVALIKESGWSEDLDLPKAPARIEAYDISNIFGEYAVGSMVVFTNGKIDKDEYRRFRIKGFKIHPNLPLQKEGIKKKRTKSTLTLLCKRREELVSPFEKEPVPNLFREGLRGISDVGMLKEVLERRFNHSEWKLPDLIIIDGGLGQFNAAKKVLVQRKRNIPIISIAKGPTRKGETLFMTKNVPIFDKKIILAIRDESHRFAIAYHRKLKRTGMWF